MFNIICDIFCLQKLGLLIRKKENLRNWFKIHENFQTIQTRYSGKCNFAYIYKKNVRLRIFRNSIKYFAIKITLFSKLFVFK